MSRRTETIAPEYFEDLYREHGDPWRFETSEYERAKYADTLEALPRETYDSALEVGCSIGVLTRRLAARCKTLLALDAAATPLAEARQRCRECENVEFAQIFVPREWPTGAFDLIVLSEVVYYFDRNDLKKLAARVIEASAPNAHVMLVHWTGETNYPLSGDEAADLFLFECGDRLDIVSQIRRPNYRLDSLQRR